LRTQDLGPRSVIKLNELIKLHSTVPSAWRKARNKVQMTRTKTANDARRANDVLEENK
jgi:hypothetical protein